MPHDHHVVLFTRKGCHLCEQALAKLRDEHLEVESIDIDTRPHYLRLYDQVVPVVVIDGKERFRGEVDRRLLRRLLAAQRAADE
ncbi:MAG: glutaredoxin family protein [Pirellulales bacterium]